jgi:hypothetical protein
VNGDKGRTSEQTVVACFKVVLFRHSCIEGEYTMKNAARSVGNADEIRMK